MLTTFLLLVAPVLAPNQGPIPSNGEGDLSGIEEIRADRIRADLFFFADDAMRGRDTPSPEQRIAARYLRARLERLGFTPGAGASFFFEYALARKKVDPERSFLGFSGPGGTERLVFGEDYFISSSRYAGDGSFSGPVRFLGEASKEACEAASLPGAWGVTVDDGGSILRRARNAERSGASGLIVLTDPASGLDPFPVRFRKTTELAKSGVSSPRIGAHSKRAFFPVYYLSKTGTEALLAAAGSADLAGLASGLDLRVESEQVGDEETVLEDVCALWPGSDPRLRDEVLIVSAHYDHVGVRDGEIYNGADDNGSGSMGLLAIAEALAARGPLRRSVMLVWVSGEEKGLWGSAAWTEAPTLPAGTQAICDLNIDMIGRNAPDHLLITPTRDHPASNWLSRLVTRLSPLEGFPRLGSADEYWARSDHMNFSQNLKIPVAFLFSGEHEDYHRPTDTPDKIDCDKVARVARLVFRVLVNLQGDTLPS